MYIQYTHTYTHMLCQKSISYSHCTFLLLLPLKTTAAATTTDLQSFLSSFLRVVVALCLYDLKWQLFWIYLAAMYRFYYEKQPSFNDKTAENMRHSSHCKLQIVNAIEQKSPSETLATIFKYDNSYAAIITISSSNQKVSTKYKNALSTATTYSHYMYIYSFSYALYVIYRNCIINSWEQH